MTPASPPEQPEPMNDPDSPSLEDVDSMMTPMTPITSDESEQTEADSASDLSPAAPVKQKGRGKGPPPPKGKGRGKGCKSVPPMADAKGTGKGPAGPRPPPKGKGMESEIGKRPSFRVSLSGLKHHVAAFHDLTFSEVKLKEEEWTQLHTLFEKEDRSPSCGLLFLFVFVALFCPPFFFSVLPLGAIADDCSVLGQPATRRARSGSSRSKKRAKRSWTREASRT